MEIVVPQPYQGYEEEDSSSSEEEEDNQDGDHIVEIEMQGQDQEEWEDVSSDPDEGMVVNGHHHFEDENNPFVDEGSDDESGESEESDASDEFDHEVEDYLGMEPVQPNRTNRSRNFNDYFQAQARERGANWITENRTISTGNTIVDVTLPGARARSSLDDTIHPLLTDHSSETRFETIPIAVSADSRHVYEVYRDLFGSNDYFSEYHRDHRGNGFGMVGAASKPVITMENDDTSPTEKQLAILHAHKIMQSIERWQQEARLVFNGKVNEVASKVINAILNSLSPEAMAAIHKAEEARKKEKNRLEEEKLALQTKEEQEKLNAETETDNEMSVDHPESSNQHGNDRQIIMIDGIAVDITGSGIDITFLEALPDELRQEVIQEHLRERTIAQQIISGDSMSLNPDFLNALPPDMRDEVMEQERLEVEARRQAAERESRNGITAPIGSSTSKSKAAPPKESAHLLDSGGIASLLRLLFLPQTGEMDTLEKILCNLCENSRSRADILSLLLSVLMNEPSNLTEVEKTFAIVIGKAQFGNNSLSSSDQIPHLVSQRCLEVLSHLSSDVPAIAKYFLTENEIPLAPRTPKSSKKSKGKDKIVLSQPSFPIVILLNLLEKNLFLNNQSVLEELIQLLAQLLRPLAHVAKKKFSEIETSTTQQTPMKEKHDIKLPAIPPKCVQAVVLALKDSVSSGKTFQSTLSVLQHLCSYPNNLEIVASELLCSSKELSLVNAEDVQSLQQQLLVLKEDESISADILAAFTTSTASQAKFLRILKAIDYLFSKNHGKFY
jgi:hypothetical protein